MNAIVFVILGMEVIRSWWAGIFVLIIRFISRRLWLFSIHYINRRITGDPAHVRGSSFLPNSGGLNLPEFGFRADGSMPVNIVFCGLFND